MSTPRSATDSDHGSKAAYLRVAQLVPSLGIELAQQAARLAHANLRKGPSSCTFVDSDKALPSASLNFANLPCGPDSGHGARRTRALRLICSITSLIAPFLFAACSREPEAVTRAYELMSRRMCKDAIPALKTAVAERPDDTRIPRALCEASLCARTQERGSKENNSPTPQDLVNYCVQGYAGVQEVKLLLKKEVVFTVLGGQGMDSGDKADDALSAALAQYPNDPDVKWQGAYTLTGEHRQARQGKVLSGGDSGAQHGQAASTGSKGVALAASALGSVRVNSKACIIQDKAKARRAVVRRGGAKIFVLKGEVPEARFEPGAVFAVTGINGERVQFNDTEHEHWKPGTGWITWKSEEQDCMWAGCQPPNWCGGVSVPLDGRYVTRYLPSDTFISQLSAAPTGGITVRPGTLKYLGKTISSSVREFAACHRQHVLYRDVAFEERDAPVREVPTSEIFLLSDDCPTSVSTLIREYSEWDEGVIEALLRGEIRQGMPSLMLKQAGWREVELFFDRDAAVVVGGLVDAGSRRQEVIVRNGRVQ